MIAFTVMDHDVLTANDFAGEAFLALGNIPGVADYSTSIDNFHGLKQVDLPLMQQNDKSMYTIQSNRKRLEMFGRRYSEYSIWHISFSDHPILQILESRTSDKQAVEFVRKQKARLAN